MCEGVVGVDTSAADQAGAETASLAQRYATIGADFRTELSRLGQASLNEMQVVTAAEEYCGDIVGQLVQLQSFTGALGDSAQEAAAAARQADYQIGTGLGSVYAA